MSPSLKNLGLFAVPLLLLLLTAIAGYAYTQIRSLSLPIPQALALFTVILPLITGISAQGTYGLIRRSANNTQYQLTIPLIAVIGVQMIYETVIATLALTHMVPPDSLICGLESKWQQFWSAHDIKAGDSIRTIQDALNCCGFNSLKDRSWPFTEPATCAKQFRRTQSCAEPWRRAEQINAGLLLLVALTVFIIKVLSLLSLLTSTSFSQSKWARPFKQIGNIADVEDVNGSGEDNRATVRRLIEENVEEYHDEPSTTHSTSAINAQEREQDHGPRVQPSPLTDGGSEWRD
ncbi:hypothetical protein WAI453_007790 [Rhynchosporium graminicola]|uniref:Tetraspanin Tsp3 n=1 Tax=Rhynchosporium graminicola TaxID=2792576 RepID=A0A1E1L292_9HELO|nr:uncharacterized protein RCO7_05499 [Rhynchosporium commune]